MMTDQGTDTHMIDNDITDETVVNTITMVNDESGFIDHHYGVDNGVNDIYFVYNEEDNTFSMEEEYNFPDHLIYDAAELGEDFDDTMEPEVAQWAKDAFLESINDYAEKMDDSLSVSMDNGVIIVVTTVPADSGLTIRELKDISKDMSNTIVDNIELDVVEGVRKRNSDLSMDNMKYL